ncbi:OmpA family protein [Flavobacterium psychrophilum]|uniref:OmpA family protein n=1 Tax=Flavobacterium psychrophilum TaxID=96345 RepID=UPI002C55059C|nr:OmpA family protein [Flavobacterium psychrophilum]MEB3392491.1 OmpA family protein [Flavobacterium psychrophilum]MEB3394888.1 OmpA family protein [Flavobacterium psychrophilum]MEB3402082.1 OmpA family protein [Flavobacterium psychrophilum]MEB3406881.1 OmpA family protein [Flavobacterium psychrophilum]
MKKLFIYILFLVNIYLANAQEQFSVYFDSNKYELSGQENKELQTWISQNPTSKVLAINGYTDEDGTNQYNDTLALKRVQKVYQNIKQKINIREDFKTRSFGEHSQQSKNKSENRKVTIYYLLQKDIIHEDEILGLKSKEKTKIKKPIVFPNKVVIDNFNGTKSEYKLDVKFMEALCYAVPGTKLKLNNLNFITNTFAVTNDSRGKLYELLLVMQQRPEMIISIHGHLCCVSVDRKDLSTQRAKAVKQFLELNGIEKTRMDFKGFGSSIPLFPLPENTEEERAANRRVEIEVIEN